MSRFEFTANRSNRSTFYYTGKGQIWLNKKTMSSKVKRSGVRKNNKSKDVIAEGMYDPNSRAFS